MLPNVNTLKKMKTSEWSRLTYDTWESANYLKTVYAQ